MRFLQPEILYFLPAVLIPLLVHLLKMHRYRKVYFSNVALLQSIQTEQRRSSKLREILIMIARMLLIFSLVMAFSQPYIPVDEHQTSVGGQTVVSIYLDNSFSMQAPSENEILLYRAKEEVRNILAGCGPQTQVQLLTNDFSGEEQDFHNPFQVESMLQDIGFSYQTRTFSQICARQDALMEVSGVEPGSDMRYYVSDFQKSGWQLPTHRWEGDSLGRFVFVPLPHQEYANLSLDSLWLDRPLAQAGSPMQLDVMFTNHSGSVLEQVPLRLFVNGNQAGVYSVNAQAQTSGHLTVPIYFNSPGMYSCYLELSDYPVDFDNRLYFSVNVLDKMEVMQVGTLPSVRADKLLRADSWKDGNPQHQGENMWLRKIFSNDSSFVYRWADMETLDLGLLSSQRLIMFHDQGDISSALVSGLRNYVEQGGCLLLLPPWVDLSGKESALEGNTLMDQLLGASYGPWIWDTGKVERIAWEDALFSTGVEEVDENVRLPMVKGYYRLPEARVKTDAVVYTPLMELQTGEDFLSCYTLGKGRIFVLACQPHEAYTDFYQNFSFVVATLNMALLSGDSPRLYYDLQADHAVFLPMRLFENQESRFHIYSVRSGSAPQQNIDVIPRVERVGWELGFFTHQLIGRDGNYIIGVEDEAHRMDKQVLPYKPLYPVSFNVSRLESQQACYGEDELKEWIASCGHKGFYLLNPEKTDLRQRVEQLNMGTELWKVFIIFAFVFALVEILLLRGVSPRISDIRKSR